jgi:hypothetical protein
LDIVTADSLTLTIPTGAFPHKLDCINDKKFRRKDCLYILTYSQLKEKLMKLKLNNLPEDDNFSPKMNKFFKLKEKY